MLMQAVTHCRAFSGARDPACISQDFEVLRDRSLGNGQEIDDVAGDAARMGDQKLYDLKAMGVAQSFEHGYQPLLFSARDV